LTVKKEKNKITKEVTAVKNLTGIPYHIENQRYMYVQEHGEEISRSAKIDQIERAAELEDRIKIQSIIDLVKKNCGQMSIGEKYYIGGKGFKGLRAESLNKSVLKVHQKEGFIQAVKPGQAILRVSSSYLNMPLDIPVKVLTWKEFYERETKEAQRRMAEFLKELGSR